MRAPRENQACRFLPGESALPWPRRGRELSSWDGSPQGWALLGNFGLDLLRREGWTPWELRLEAGSHYGLVTLCQFRGMPLPDCVAHGAWHSGPVVAKSSPRCRGDRCPCAGRPPWLLPQGWLASLQEPWAGEPPGGRSRQSSRAALEAPLLLRLLWRPCAQGDATRLSLWQEAGATQGVGPSLPPCFVAVLLL